MSKQVIFTVTNHHVADCGYPPSIDDQTPGRYHGFFENEYGEQAIFVYDHATRRGTLYLGDGGRQTPYEVKGGRVPEFVLSQQEQAWLAVCRLAATANERVACTAGEGGSPWKGDIAWSPSAP